MKTIKVIIIFVLMTVLIGLLSVNVEIGDTKAVNAQILGLACWCGLIYALAKYSSLFEFDFMYKPKHPELFTPELEQFLYKKGVLESVLNNINSQKFVFSDQLTNLSKAFIWCDSPEGYDYWSVLEDEFKEYLSSKNNLNKH